MNNYKITIPVKKMANGKWNKFPSLNDYIKAERTTIRTRNGKMLTKGAIMKKEWQQYFSVFIRKCMGRTVIDKPLIVHYHYFEPDRKRDFGNIHAPTQKFFEDALQDCGTILNDNQRYIKGFTASFDIDTEMPRVEVEIEVLG